MPRAFTETEKRLIRERLLEAGYKQFSMYGLKKTSIEDLAAAAGISKAAFYIFFESKEVLFMDAVERVEEEFRGELLAAVEEPGPSPRARLFAVLKRGLTLFRTVPILRFLTGGDFELLSRRVSAEKLQEHLASDRVFFEEMIARCKGAGIEIRARPEEIGGLLYALVLALLHEDDLGASSFGGSFDTLLELVAAFCLGEITIQMARWPGPPGA